jgi:hypothetical protein
MAENYDEILSEIFSNGSENDTVTNIMAVNDKNSRQKIKKLCDTWKDTNNELVKRRTKTALSKLSQAICFF